MVFARVSCLPQAACQCVQLFERRLVRYLLRRLHGQLDSIAASRSRLYILVARRLDRVLGLSAAPASSVGFGARVSNEVQTQSSRTPSVAFPYPSPAWLTVYYGAIGTGDVAPTRGPGQVQTIDR